MELELEDDAAPILCRLRGGDDELPSIGSFSIVVEGKSGQNKFEKWLHEKAKGPFQFTNV